MHAKLLKATAQFPNPKKRVSCRDLRDAALDEASRAKSELRQLRQQHEELLLSSRESASRSDVSHSQLMGELKLKGFELTRLQVGRQSCKTRQSCRVGQSRCFKGIAQRTCSCVVSFVAMNSCAGEMGQPWLCTCVTSQCSIMAPCMASRLLHVGQTVFAACCVLYAQALSEERASAIETAAVHLTDCIRCVLCAVPPGIE